MNVLAILLFCSNCLFVSCAVSKCYEANNIDFYSSNLTVVECNPSHTGFCATTTFRNGDFPDVTCGDEELCYRKDCDNTMHCTKPGTFELDYVHLKNVKFTITCCDTDLCNVENSAKTLYKISFNCFSFT